MDRIQEIEKRLADINLELEAENADLDAFATEIKELKEERQALKDKIEKRNALTNEVKVEATVVKEFKEERKEKMDIENRSLDEIYASPEYRTAYFKRLMGKELNEVEKRSMAVAGVDIVPTQTANQIFTIMRQHAPLLDEITLAQFPGNLKYGVESTNNDAAIHTENGEITAEEDTVGSVSLGGYEIVKLVRISASLKTMAVPAFESWLVGILAENIATAVENYIINGSGSSQPKGLDYYRTWADGTNAVDFGAAAPTLAELRELVSYLGGRYYRNAKWVMKHSTYWGLVQTNRSDSDHGMFTQVGDEHYLLGKKILFSDYARAGDLFLADLTKIIANFAEPINVKSSAESGFIYNAVDYRAACQFDCDCIDANCVVKGAADLTAGA